MQWFRFYSEALDDPKVQRLPGDVFKAWVNLLCLANESEDRGSLPSLDDVAFRLRLDAQRTDDVTGYLLRAGLLEEDETGLHIHGWESRQKKSDNVTLRVQQHRSKGKTDETLQERFGNALDKSRVDQKRSEERRVEDVVALPLARAPRPVPKRADARPPKVLSPSLADYQPSAAIESFVAEQCPTVALNVEVEQWRDYHTAKGDAIRDLDASLRTWLRNAGKWSRAPATNGHRPDADQKTAENIQRVLARRGYA